MSAIKGLKVCLLTVNYNMSVHLSLCPSVCTQQLTNDFKGLRYNFRLGIFTKICQHTPNLFMSEEKQWPVYVTAVHDNVTAVHTLLVTTSLWLNINSLELKMVQTNIFVKTLTRFLCPLHLFHKSCSFQDDPSKSSERTTLVLSCTHCLTWQFWFSQHWCWEFWSSETFHCYHRQKGKGHPITGTGGPVWK
jgi:hypothetical protein